MDKKVIDIISKIAKIDQKTLNKNLNQEDLWDSFTLVEIIFALEEEFNVVFDEDDFSQIKNVQTIIELVLRKVSDEA